MSIALAAISANPIAQSSSCIRPLRRGWGRSGGWNAFERLGTTEVGHEDLGFSVDMLPEAMLACRRRN